MLNELLNELEDTWDFTSEELKDIRSAIVNYTICALMDSRVRKECEIEAEQICS
jgi:hypothetical protein